MPKIEIFEPAGCCATTSAVIAEESIKFNVDIEWAKRNNIDIKRYSLSKNPQIFVNNPVVSKYLRNFGAESLPVSLLDGNIVQSGQLPARSDIARWAGISVNDEEFVYGDIPPCCCTPRLP
ncbi:arsenic metallochaperone ArsD family protein [Dongshaea marina]|uniref:arsenic metallochaperone ArsD family protein n=1 Tax=Dongshaea marina TaxID=2047966 RepID=UPI000D3ED204|nr:arsenic metallochaperone ArsD family protein [Dongshaea marina]